MIFQNIGSPKFTSVLSTTSFVNETIIHSSIYGVYNISPLLLILQWYHTNSCTDQWEKEREECVSDDNDKWGERSLILIQVTKGDVTCLLGFMILHDDVLDLDNLHMCGHKFKNTFMLVQIWWSLGCFWYSQKEEFNAIINFPKGVFQIGIWPLWRVLTLPLN